MIHDSMHCQIMIVRDVTDERCVCEREIKQLHVEHIFIYKSIIKYNIIIITYILQINYICICMNIYIKISIIRKIAIFDFFVRACIIT